MMTNEYIETVVREYLSTLDTSGIVNVANWAHWGANEIIERYNIEVIYGREIAEEIVSILKENK